MRNEQIPSEGFERAWLDAASDLGIDVVAPFTLRVAERDLTCVALVRGFGKVNGMVVLRGGVSEWQGVRDLLNAASELGYGHSFVRDSYARYDRALFVDTLNDWGWQRETEPPDWYTGEPWTA